MQRGIISIFIILFLFPWVQNLSYSQMSIKNNELPFSRFNIIHELPSANREEQEHLCIFDCTFTIPFGQPLILPSNCREERTSNACEIEVKVELSMNFTAFFFWDKTIDLIIDDVHLDTYSAAIVGFDFDDKGLSYTISYKCSYGDKCEWKYIEEKLPNIIMFDYLPLFNSLSSLLYNERFESNEVRCYSLDELTECQSGICDFTQILEHENLTLTNIRQCLISDRPKIYFGHYRYTPGPMKYDFDYLYFICNINECNSPSNELAVKRLIGFIDDKNSGSIKLGCLSAVFSLYFIISFMIKI